MFTNSVANGVSAKIQGRKFMEGLRSALVTSMLSFSYTRTVGQMANPSPGQGVSPNDGKYDAIYGAATKNIPPDIRANNFNITGVNEKLTYNGDGTLAFWANFDKQGGFISNVMNSLPGINAVAALHDTWWNPGRFMGLSFNPVTNWGTMLPAAVMTYGALAESPYFSNSVRVDRLLK